MGSPVAEVFRKAAEVLRADPRRSGHVLSLGGAEEFLVSGDLHGNRANLARIVSHASLASHPGRVLVLQEIAHGPDDRRTGHDRSVEVLLRAVRLMLERPEQVLFVLGNHDVAQVTGNEITKQGRGSCEAFEKGVREGFGDDAEEILQAVDEYLLAIPLAIRCGQGVWISHSLPAPSRTALAGTDVFDWTGPYPPESLRRGGPVYEWTWGRAHTPEQIDALAERLGVEFFLLGHQHVEAGFEVVSPRAMVVASDHNRGCLCRFGADETLTGETAPDHVLQIQSLR
jgi:hypothetical protein